MLDKPLPNHREALVDAIKLEIQTVTTNTVTNCQVHSYQWLAYTAANLWAQYLAQIL